MDITDNQIARIIEKPETRHRISSGIYAMKGKAIRSIPKDEFFTMPDLINSYLNRGARVGAYKIENFWIGIENAENLDEVLKRLEGTST